jgi:hypothetical protein
MQRHHVIEGSRGLGKSDFQTFAQRTFAEMDNLRQGQRNGGSQIVVKCRMCVCRESEFQNFHIIPYFYPAKIHNPLIKKYPILFVAIRIVAPQWVPGYFEMSGGFETPRC